MNLIVRDNIGNEFEGRGGVSMPAEVAKQLRDALNEAYPVEPQQLKPYYMVDEDRVVRVTSAHERVVHHDTVAYAAGSADPHFIADALNKAAA